MVREGSVVFGIWKMGEDPLINIFLPVLMELRFHIFHYTPFMLITQGRFPGQGKVIFSGFGHFALLAGARAGFFAEWTEIMDVANRQG